MPNVSILNVGTSTWKKQEASQYGGSDLTELVSIKSVSKDRTSLSISMGGYLKKNKKKKKNEILTNS